MATLIQRVVTLRSGSFATEAKTLRAALLSFGKNILSVDDSTMDLPIRQLKVCLALSVQSGSMTEISREAGLSASAMTQVTDRLERRGLVERAFANDDRRARVLRLTPKGQKLMRSHEEAQLARITAVLASLTEREISQVLKGFELFDRSARRESDTAV